MASALALCLFLKPPCKSTSPAPAGAGASVWAPLSLPTPCLPRCPHPEAVDSASKPRAEAGEWAVSQRPGQDHVLFASLSLSRTRSSWSPEARKLGTCSVGSAMALGDHKAWAWVPTASKPPCTPASPSQSQHLLGPRDCPRLIRYTGSQPFQSQTQPQSRSTVTSQGAPCPSSSRPTAASGVRPGGVQMYVLPGHQPGWGRHSLSSPSPPRGFGVCTVVLGREAAK